MSDWDGIARVRLEARETFRLIAAAYPAIDLYADLGVPPTDWDVLHEIEGLTNARLRDERGEAPRVPPAERVTGAGASWIMAPFSRPNRSRFSDGTYGIYYCAERERTAIREVSHHRQRFLRATREPSQTLVQRTVAAALRGTGFDVLDRPWPWLRAEDYGVCQRFGAHARGKVDAIRYESVRDPGAVAFAVLAPRALAAARHLHYVELNWDGARITHHSIVGEP